MSRETYRHGDLYRALVDAGLDLARGSGPDAVVLREATRSAHVAPSAAYRHFSNRDSLVHEVSMAAQAKLAAAIEAEQVRALAALPEPADPAVRARALLRSVGAGYLKFAWAEPGWFRTAFLVHQNLANAGNVHAAGPQGRTPYQLLSESLDALSDSGVLPPERRPGAEVLAWSTVHGFATLTIDGPLRDFDAKTREALADRLLKMVEAGL
jgi:AcrR family transcriptional regulator